MGRPEIPASVALRLRQEGRFGCCECGRPVYQYHHIIDYAADPHFRPADMMILCPYCHDEATKGAMTEHEQRHYKANPYNVRRGFASGQLKINQNDCVIALSSLLLRARGDLVVVDGESILGLDRNSDGGMNLSARLYDQEDNLLLTIKDNVWISGDVSAWDLESDFQYLRIRQRKGDIRIEVDTKSEPIRLRANLWKNGENIQINNKEIMFASQNLAFRKMQISGCFYIDSRMKSMRLGPFRRSFMNVSANVLLLHEDKVFEDQTIFLSGNFYKRCTFRRCTLVLKGSVTIASDCTIDSCIWNLDILISDPSQWDAFLRDTAPVISDTLPRIPTGPAPAGDGEEG